MSATDDARQVIDRYLAALSANAPVEEVAAMFAVDCDYVVAGDKSVAWWVGRRSGREDIARFYTEMRAALEPVTFNVEAILTDGDRGVVVGDFANRVRSTGRTFSSPFVIHALIRDGLIRRYLFLEDTAAARAAATP